MDTIMTLCNQKSTMSSPHSGPLPGSSVPLTSFLPLHLASFCLFLLCYFLVLGYPGLLDHWAVRFLQIRASSGYTVNAE